MKIFSSASSGFRSAATHHQAIFKGMAFVSVFVLLAKVVGAAKEMAVAYRYGAGAEVDAYLFVFNWIALPTGAWFSVLTVVLVPLSVRLKYDAASELPQFRAELFGTTLLIGAGLAMAAWIGLGFMLHSAWAGLPPRTAALAARALVPLVFVIPLSLLCGLFSCLVLASGRHINTLLEGIPALIIGAAVLMFAHGSIELLVWGTITGFALQAISLAIPLVRDNEIEAPRFAWSSAQWRLFWQGFGITVVGQALISAQFVVDQYFAAPEGTGSIALLGYANRLFALILGIGATAVSRATLSIFSKSEMQEGSQTHQIVLYWMRLLFLLGVSAVVLGWWLAPVAVKLLFERGTFSTQNSAAVTELLRYGLAQLPFYLSGMVLVSYASSRRRYMLIFWSSVIAIVVKLIANTLLVPHLGLKGITSGSALMYASTAYFLWFTLGRTKPAAREAPVRDGHEPFRDTSLRSR
ncbi:hypothetical protein E4K72_17525 [Oxalobacteraceae bacterium OM1]|nr:hypothetical protein E4K72_17525 [Oxalobacteraceae bacterium OM1]